DPYRTGVHRYWHLARASAELKEALAEGWIRAPGTAVDLGCGLGVEASHLAGVGFRAIGVDLSGPALTKGAAAHPNVRFVRADVRSLPFGEATVDALVDRGCLHYLTPQDRRRY